MVLVWIAPTTYCPALWLTAPWGNCFGRARYVMKSSCAMRLTLCEIVSVTKRMTVLWSARAMTRATTLPLRSTAPMTALLRLTLRPLSSPSWGRTVPVLALTADVGFINLNDPDQLTEFLIGEPGAEPVAHVPSGPIRAESKRAIDLKRADAFF